MDQAEAENVYLRSVLQPRHGVVTEDLPPVTAAPDEVYDDGRKSPDEPPSGKSETPEE